MSCSPFTPFPILSTERLHLRQLKIDDDQVILALRSDPEVNKYLDRPPSKTIEDARIFINQVNDNISKNLSLYYWAITLTESNTMVGIICLFGFSDEDSSCEIGYELLPKFQGQGIMKEAANKIIDFAFNKVNLQIIEASLHRDNQPSLKLLEKLSFQKSNKVDHSSPELICYERVK